MTDFDPNLPLSRHNRPPEEWTDPVTGLTYRGGGVWCSGDVGVWGDKAAGFCLLDVPAMPPTDNPGHPQDLHAALRWLRQNLEPEVLGCEATTACLLCGGDGCGYCADARPDWLGRCTPTQEREALRGRHPLGWDLHPDPPEGARCGTCAHLVRRPTPGGRTHLKCGERPMTKGPATDTRARWPACERYEETP